MRSHISFQLSLICTLFQEFHHLKKPGLEITSKKCNSQEVDTKGNFVPLDIGKRQLEFKVLEMYVWTRVFLGGNAVTREQKPQYCLYTNGSKSFGAILSTKLLSLVDINECKMQILTGFVM